MFLFAGEVSAQCAAKVSSCALCHATSDRAPERRPNADWHRDHAIGDFCAGCHGGDPAAQAEADAHAGLVSPLAEPSRSCAPCHAAGFDERAQRYSARLAERAPSPPAPLAPRPRGSRNGLVAAVAVLVASAGVIVVLLTERRRRLSRASESP